eukprot:m.59480 g.59480  ORF g.59480 m.59480 type:complete len:479 (-) comp12987_c0_seq1:146-1582(-)
MAESPSEAAAKAKFSESGIVFTPADDIFADERGKVRDAATPKLFVGTILADRFEITRYIESGAFGRGWVAKDTSNGEEIFLKTFRSVLDRPGPVDAKAHEKMVKKEIELLLTAERHHLPAHPNLVSWTTVHYGTVSVPKTGRQGEMFFIVTPDLCEGGELYNYLVFGNGIKKFDEKMARYFFKQLANGVAHMHQNKIFHRDLKLENVVLDSRYVAKIMDFGHAKHASECETKVDRKTGEVHYMTPTFVGTASYQPPELKSGTRGYNPAAFDIWSLGVILFFLVGIEGLAAKGNDFTFISKVKARSKGFDYLDQKRSDKVVPDNKKFWDFFGTTLKFSKELKHLLNGMFDLNSEKRMTINQILEHPWLQGPEPTHEEVVATLSGRSTGIIPRDFVFSLEEQAGSQEEALELVEAAVKQIAPYKKHGHKIGVCIPPQFAIAVGSNRKVRVMWLTGGLDEWLEFRGLVHKALDIPEGALAQ